VNLKIIAQNIFISMFVFTSSQTLYALDSDQYENDNIFSAAKLLFVGEKFTQTHTLHKPDDIDWIMFNGIKGRSYRITTKIIGDGCQIQLVLFEIDGQTLIKTGVPNLYGYSIGWHFSITRLYLIKVMHDEGCEIPITYELHIIDETANTSQLIWGYVKDQYCKTPISGVEVSIVDISNGKTRTKISQDGFYNNTFVEDFAGYYCFEDHPVGEYRLSAKKYHMETASPINVTLESNIESYEDIYLISKCNTYLPYLFDKEIQLSDIIGLLQIISGINPKEEISVCNDAVINLKNVIALLKCLSN